ncbi:MAG TPA: CRTAC1 family protein [Thermoanaerobaculia bacterium]|nr:CRTAC1 family protein [Thermoanaerobaculia bacterium]
MTFRVPVAAALLAAAACAVPPALPTISEYTGGASSVAADVDALFRTGRAAAPLAGAPAAPIRAAAESWREQAAEGATVETTIVGFPRRPERSARMRVRVVLSGLRRGDPAARVFADERFALDLERGESGWAVAGCRAEGESAVRSARPHLEEVSRAWGVAATHEACDPAEKTNYCIPATHHHPGIVLADFDGDGALDILLPSLHPRLLLNDGRGRFRDATAGSGLDRLPPGEAAGGIAADLDGDGRPEIFLTYAYSACRLLHNEGGGKFRDVTAESGLAGLSGTYTSAVFFDADGDGRLDLFVAAYGDARTTGPAYSGKNGPGSRFFRQVPRGGKPFFVDETESAGFTDRGWAFAASACDYDGDGDDDLYVANDFGKNCLYENVSTPGTPRFREVAAKAGVLDDGYGMGVTWGDYDNDGRFDLHVADFSSPYRWLIRSPKLPMPPLPAVVQAVARPIVVPMLLRRCQGDGLYRNRGDGTFERTSESAGVAEGGWAWGTELVDLDGDGREDLLVVNGMWEAAPDGRSDEVKFWNEMSAEGVAFHDGYWGGIDFGKDGMASHSRKHLYRNLGGGRFEDDAWLEGFDTRADTRGLAFGDLDGDGAPDIALSTFRGPVLVYRNGWTTPRRLTLRLVGKSPGNRDAIGAVVRLSSGGMAQIREVRAGSSYLSCSAKELYFGLGTAAAAETIEVRWPDGSREVRRNVAPGLLVWKEGAP